MKKLFVVIMLLSLTTISFGAIINTEGETKVGQAIKQIYSQVDSLRNSVGVIYARAKQYVIDHPTQFSADDKTKLNGLQAEITSVDTTIANLKTYIQTNFSGINE